MFLLIAVFFFSKIGLIKKSCHSSVKLVRSGQFTEKKKSQKKGIRSRDWGVDII